MTQKVTVMLALELEDDTLGRRLSRESLKEWIESQVVCYGHLHPEDERRDIISATATIVPKLTGRTG